MRHSRRRGYSYAVSSEKIRWWNAIPAQQKLQWLEEANAFLRKALDSKTKKIMEKFRKGEI